MIRAGYLAIAIISLTGCGSGSSSSSSDKQNKNINYAADIGGVLSATVSEDDSAVINRQLTITDPNSNESSFREITDLNSQYGIFSLDSDGNWTYQLHSDDARVQSLQQDQQLTDDISIESADRTAATISITILGQNDSPTFSGGDNVDFAAIDVNEANQVSGQIIVTDIDTNESQFIVQQQKTGNYGWFSISSNGEWQYQLDENNATIKTLSHPQAIDEAFSIQSVDNSKHQISINIFNSVTRTDLGTHELGIELNDWYLSVPTDTDNNGRSDSISENKLANGYSDEFFYVSEDNGLVFRCPVDGFKTSTNTKYVRVELREMLRRGNSGIKTQGVNLNNWVFGSAPDEDINAAGGVDGELTATLAINSVTTTGESYQIGRAVIGQIHANDDEPIRLYYRKLPNNSKGSVYFAHEPIGEDDDYYELIGSRDNDAADPVDGIALDEKFTYVIKTEGNQLTATIKRDNKPDVSTSIDMSGSGYDQGGQYMYFKAGVYNGNNSADSSEYTQATFYELRNSHTGYAYSE
ncbi:polysaccharide lyase family 7 protein [Thalassotalea sp. Y01]|uniref:polysaccharide lyase family 7 protein n=1 Tax=Thalassotalea sp. Y01 TaxID=2729613 RepID=UPI00145C5CE2|nr:polysaccharide lyase family 7 protein [Thalassotalea sp. Y01]NMP16884.1 hypothetical protein [Thalassotalea sp. Y01]